MSVQIAKVCDRERRGPTMAERGRVAAASASSRGAQRRGICLHAMRDRNRQQIHRTGPRQVRGNWIGYESDEHVHDW